MNEPPRRFTRAGDVLQEQPWRTASAIIRGQDPTIRIVLELTPTGRWRAMLDGTKLLVTSREPVRSAARVLLAEGLDPATVLEARNKGSAEVVQRATLEAAAQDRAWKPSRDGLERAGSPWPVSAGGPGPGARSRGLRDPLASISPVGLENEP